MILSNFRHPRENHLKSAVLCMMFSVFFYALQDVLVKMLPSDMHVMQICFFRAIFALIPIFIYSLTEPSEKLLKTKNWSMHFWRSLFSSFALFCFIGSFRLIPLADAYTLSFSCPLFMVALCIPLLNEKVSLSLWLAVIAGFIGVLIMMRPGSDTLEVGGILALVGGFFYALSLIFVRKLSHQHQDSSTLIVLTFTVMSAFLTLPFLPFVWQPVDTQILWQLMTIGVLGGSAQLAMTQAFRLAPVSKLAPFDYASLIWAVAFGYLFFGEKPDTYVIAGALLIVSSGMMIMNMEKNARI